MIFDFLTTTCGMYARAIVPELSNPVASYPALAKAVLPVGLLGLFAVSLLSTIMSTVDSYSFIAASTFGNDIVPRLKKISESQIVKLTQYGLVFSAAMAIIWALFFQSAVDIWHAFGSIAAPALLVPLVSTFTGGRRLSSNWAFISIFLCGGISLVWYLSKYFSNGGSYWLGIEPIFSGLLISVLIYLVLAKRAT
jgi:SSS family solute:Na+ symporter